LDANLSAPDFELPADAVSRLSAAGAPGPGYPYHLFHRVVASSTATAHT
jgi:hypothetical protein